MVSLECACGRLGDLYYREIGSRLFGTCGLEGIETVFIRPLVSDRGDVVLIARDDVREIHVVH